MCFALEYFLLPYKKAHWGYSGLGPWHRNSRTLSLLSRSCNPRTLLDQVYQVKPTMVKLMSLTAFKEMIREQVPVLPLVPCTWYSERQTAFDAAILILS